MTDHYQQFLKRIQTRKDFVKEMTGKIRAIRESGYPIPIEDKHIDEVVSILCLNTIGDPQFWPPQ